MSRTHFDVVLMDLQMPIMDGFQATAAIRALPAGKQIPIIALTAHALNDDRDRCRTAGMNDFISSRLTFTSWPRRSKGLIENERRKSRRSIADKPPPLARVAGVDTSR